jgi:hypothetical protein
MNYYCYILIIGDDSEGKCKELHYECHFITSSAESWFLTNKDRGDKIHTATTSYTQKDMGKNQVLFSIAALQKALFSELCIAIAKVQLNLEEMTAQNWETKRQRILAMLPTEYLQFRIDHKGNAKQLQFYKELCEEYGKKSSNVRLVFGSQSIQ